MHSPDGGGVLVTYCNALCEMVCSNTMRTYKMTRATINEIRNDRLRIR